MPAPAPADTAAQKRALAALTPAQLAVAALVEMACEASDDPNPEMVELYASVARRRLADALRALGPAQPVEVKTAAPEPPHHDSRLGGVFLRRSAEDHP